MRFHRHTVPHRAPAPRPEGPVDPRLEEAAAQALELRRGKAVSRGGPPQAGAIAARLVRPSAKARKAGLTLAELRRQWREIVGDKIAAMTEPEKITDAASGRTLTLKAAGPAAPFIQHQTALILERCNLAGGGFTRVTVKQGVIARPTGNVRPLQSPLTADEELVLQHALVGIDSTRLRDALLRLGRGVSRR